MYHPFFRFKVWVLNHFYSTAVAKTGHFALENAPFGPIAVAHLLAWSQHKALSHQIVLSQVPGPVLKIPGKSHI